MMGPPRLLALSVIALEPGKNKREKKKEAKPNANQLTESLDSMAEKGRSLLKRST